MDVQIQTYVTLWGCRSLRFQYLDQPKSEKVQFVQFMYHWGEGGGGGGQR